MMLKKLLDEFKGLNDDGGNRFVEPPEEFKEIALAMLNGCIEVKSKSEPDKTVKVIPTSIEIYYHEERTGGLKDPIVYHRNNPKKGGKLPILKTGILHTHVSGIDITFESGSNPDSAIRASALIRSFRMDYGESPNTNYIWEIKDYEDRSTYIYAALYSQFSIFEGFSIEWVDNHSYYTIDRLVSQPRKNVKCFTIEENNGVETFTKQNDITDQRKWQFKIK